MVTILHPIAKAPTRPQQFNFAPSAGVVVKPTRGSSLYFSYAESTNSFNNLSAVTANGTVVRIGGQG